MLVRNKQIKYHPFFLDKLLLIKKNVIRSIMLELVIEYEETKVKSKNMIVVFPKLFANTSSILSFGIKKKANIDNKLVHEAHSFVNHNVNMPIKMPKIPKIEISIFTK
jgi:hypothetical protein